jgi:hypothetical protein
MAYQDGTNFYNVGMTMGYRNRLFNGAMTISQRNGASSVTPTSISGNEYTLDRWAARSSQASKFSVQQSTTVPSNFKNSMAITSLAATSVGSGDFYQMLQPIEGLNCADLGWGSSTAQPITLSFWVRSSLTGTFGGTILNSAETRSYVYSYTVNTANTWEYKTIVIPGDTSGTWLTTNGIGLQLRFSLGMGSTYTTSALGWAAGTFGAPTGCVNVVATNGATWFVTGVQLEEGTQATPFDWRPITTEFALCQRYFFVYDTKRSLATVFNTTDTQANTIVFPVTMRTNPTGVGITAPNITTSGNWGIYGATNGWGAVAGYTPTFTTTQDGSAVSMSGVGGVTNNYSYLIEGGARFSAEL